MKTTLLILCNLISFIVFSQNIQFPDPVLKNKLIALGIDTNSDGDISHSEALAVTTLNLTHTSSSTGPKITNMEGIQYFTNLTQLRCSNNSITTLDVTALINLEVLYCYSNQINSLNIAGLDQLVSVWASGNALTNIDLTGLDSLWWLWANNNNIDDIDLSGLVSLEALWIANNQLTEIDFFPTPNLSEIDVSGNFISELQISHLSALEILDCSSNLLEDINISNLNNLYELRIGYNLLTEIDGSDSPALYMLHCESNPDLEYINMKNGIISGADPDMLYFGFYFYDLPSLQFICIDPGEEYALSQSEYDPTNVTFSTTNCTMSVDNFAFNSIYLYPNPVNHDFNISSNENIIEYHLFDLLGKNNFTTTSFEVVKSKILQLKPSYYFLEMTTSENNKKTARFIKQ